MNTERERAKSVVSRLSSAATRLARAAAMLAGFAVIVTVASVGLVVMTAVAVGTVLMPGLPDGLRRSTAPSRKTSVLLEHAETEVRSHTAAVDGR